MRGLVLLWFAGCYAPTLREGSPCSDSEPCPTGLQCSVKTQRCEVDPTTVGADARIDVPIDTLPACASGTMMFTVTNTIESFTLPGANCTATVRIEAWGAQGGEGRNPVRPGGMGAHIAGTFTMLGGTQLQILVGGEGLASANTSSQRGGSGGGGSFVVGSGNTPLVIAGGGGGGVGGAFTVAPGGPGLAGPDGDLGGGAAGGAGGTGGNGGTSYQNPSIGAGAYHPATAGGGLLTDGMLDSNGGSNNGTPNTPGKAFVNGGAGGEGGSEGRDGGFGGGGAAGYTGGGGGGYSGGGSNLTAVAGGGGGSFNAGMNPTNEAGVNAGPGRVTISW